MNTKWVLLVLIVLALSPALATAHSGHIGSGDPVYVRVTSADLDTNMYTFECHYPETAGEERHWTVRTENATYYDSVSLDDELTFALLEEELYHVGCEVPETTEPDTDWIQSDFHIDLRTSDWTDRPNIEIISSEGREFTASCTHPTATNYEIIWHIFHPLTGTDTELTEFYNENVITYTVNQTGLWDLGCNTFDFDEPNSTLAASQWGLPIEFFEEGPAYVPNELGCFEGSTCPNDTIYNIQEGEPVPTLSIDTEITPEGSVLVTLNLTNHTLNQSSVDEPHKPGEGHAHLYIDGKKVTRFYKTTYTVWGLELGEHEIGVRLATNDHKELALNGTLIQDSKTVNITEVVYDSPPRPEWLEPSEGNEDVDSYDFHIHVFEMPAVEGHTHIATDYELWDNETNELVWASLNDTEILTHIHNADGIFQGNLEGKDRLQYDHPYKLRVRFYTDGATDNVSEWSEWREFKTAPQYTFETSPFKWTAAPGFDVQLITEGISMPVNVEVAPELYGHLPEEEQPMLYVTQLYGQIAVVYKDGSFETYADDLLNYDIFGSLPGSGEAGVTGLYVDPTTGDLFVSMVYNDNVSGLLGKVERYYTNADGNSFTSKEILLDAIPTAPSHQVQSITRGPDGKLYLQTGDDDHPFRANDPDWLSGKILRFNEDGSMPEDNPYPGTYVYATGFRNPFGGAWNPEDGKIYVTNNGPDSHDGVYQVDAGDSFGWCDGSNCDTSIGTWHTWIKTVAPVQAAFDPGVPGFSENTNEFETDDDHNLFVALSGSTYLEGPSVNSKRIVRFKFNEDGSKQAIQDIITYSGEGYGAPIGLDFDDEGLYFTDIYGEAGFIGVGLTSGRIYKVVRGNQTSDTEPNSTGFSTSIGVARWYPQGLNVIWECKPQGGSDNYVYDYYFGDGQKQLGTGSDSVYHTYPSEGVYDVSCVVHDQDTGEQVTGATTLILGEQPTTENATLTVVKVVVNDDNGTANVSDFTLYVDTQQVVSGESIELSSGTYTVSEDNIAGYEASFSGDCDASGEVTLNAGDNKTCTITNNDINAEEPVEEEPNACYTSVYEMPVTCEGQIEHDLPQGCRVIRCTLDERTSDVMACNKPGDYQAEYFEIYRTNTVGDPLEVCFGETCITNSGFAQSENFPICTGEEPAPFCGDGSVNQESEECDGSAPDGYTCTESCTLEEVIEPVCGDGSIDEGETCDDGNLINGDGCSDSCQIEEEPQESNITISTADWFPQGLDVVYVCETDESTITWEFGDGSSQTGSRTDVWHTYPAAGTYTASCSAGGLTDSMQVSLA